MTIANDLPQEIYVLIASYLSHGDIAASARVNWDWFRLFNSSVWETVVIKDDTSLELFKVSVDGGSLVRHGRCMQSLDTNYYSVIQRVANYGRTTCNNLVNLSVELKADPTDMSLRSEMLTVSCLVQLLEINPQLRSIILSGRLTRTKEPISSIVAALPQNIERLELYGGKEWEKWKDSNDPMGAINGPVNDSDKMHAATGSGLKVASPTLGLQKIVLSGAIEGEFAIFEILKRCPSLESVVFDDAIFIAQDDLSEALHDHCPALINLYMNIGFVDDGLISQLVDRSSTKGWRDLSFTGEGFGPLTEAAIMKHAGTLESLHLNIGLGFPSSSIQRLFCSAPNLKRFRGDRYCTIYADVELEAKDMIQSPWICHSLEVLQISITGIPRPDLKTRTNGRPLAGPLHEDTTMGASYQIQQRLYAQLGSLTKLKELVLGISLDELTRRFPDDLQDFEEDNEGDFFDKDAIQTGRQYECLSFTLESGMDLLRDLKELRILDLKAMAVGIDGSVEQQWIKEHWPLLRQV
ncbi:hypothetical protein BGX28_000152 [Mortierella sp. GBA30]|nr:hypothetical protein BGX28_000152 [Mortierella sp. GBA30]